MSGPQGFDVDRVRKEIPEIEWQLHLRMAIMQLLEMNEKLEKDLAAAEGESGPVTTEKLDAAVDAARAVEKLAKNK